MSFRLFLILSILSLLAVSHVGTELEPREGGGSTEPPASGDDRCGDGVCAESEDAPSCISDCWEPEDDFVTTWTTDHEGVSNDTSITLHTGSEPQDFDVDWGNDGVYDELGLTGSVTHDFGVPGTYTVRIRARALHLEQPLSLEDGDAPKLVSIDQWGTTRWTSMEGMFRDTGYLRIKATDFPDISSVTSMSGMFGGARSFNQPLEAWDVSSVTDMSRMFKGARSFNKPLGAWDTSSVTDMSGMFYDASSFDQPLATWDTSSVHDMSGVFFRASSFNQPLATWDTSSVTTMEEMFFRASSFNQPLTMWDTSSVTMMKKMFCNASSFNQSLTMWDTSSVTDMSGMFENASSFNQSLGAWQIGEVTSMGSIFSRSGLSPSRYDATLMGWAMRPSLQNHVHISAYGISYCEAETTRQTLVNTYGWVISDGGKNCL